MNGNDPVQPCVAVCTEKKSASIDANQGRIAGLDGLRALSVMVVFLHHTGLVPIHGGFIGVDVFFVLSGYLITMLLIREYDKKGKIEFALFYLRRTRRLYPALLFFLFSIAIYAWIFKPPFNTSLEIIPALLYVMNWVCAFGSYDAVMTGHTWSLAIEQQFYLLWPIVLTLLFRLCPQHRITVLINLTIIVILWRVYLTNMHASPSRTYCGFDTHSDGLLMGALLAHIRRSWMEKLGKAWIIAVAYLIFVLSTNSGNDFAVTSVGFAMTAAASATLIAKILVAQHSQLTHLLDWPPLAGLGVISYGFYLWHYAVIHVLLYSGHEQLGAFFGRFAYPDTAMLASTFAVTLAITLASWFLIESPIFNYRKNRNL